MINKAARCHRYDAQSDHFKSLVKPDHPYLAYYLDMIGFPLSVAKEMFNKKLLLIYKILSIGHKLQRCDYCFVPIFSMD